MNKIYSDGSYDDRSGIGTYCVVIIALGKKDWFIGDADTPKAETIGLTDALDVAAKLVAKTGKPTAVYCDSVEAITKLSKKAHEVGVILRHIPGHMLGKQDVVVNDHYKYHHWCDVQARAYLNYRLDNLKSVA